MTDKQDIRDWWAENPMTYGDAHGQTVYGEEAVDFGSEEMFAQVDHTFFDWNRPLHGERPFSRIFPYGDYQDRPVLEIGCGLGTMAMLWAQAGARVHAVDLNPTSIAQTRRRFESLGLEGDIREADGNHLPFADASFDYVYSWGVLHHSPNLRTSLDELVRVLKPGGRFGIMLYHRHSLLQKYIIEYIEGYLHYESRFLGPLALASRYGDGQNQEGNPHTWPVTRDEVREMLREQTRDLRIDTLGTDLDYVLPLLLPGIGSILPLWLKKPLARRFGWSLWVSGMRGSV